MIDANQNNGMSMLASDDQSTIVNFLLLERLGSTAEPQKHLAPDSLGTKMARRIFHSARMIFRGGLASFKVSFPDPQAGIDYYDSPVHSM